jgi:hypothetical protein
MLLSGLSNLTSLQLTKCSISAWRQGLAGLSLLTQLQRLHIEELKIDSAPRPRNAHQSSAWLGAALPQLTQLTHLAIFGSGLTAAALQGLSKLQQLH